MWQKLSDPDSYCFFCSIPKEDFVKADITLATFLGSAPLWAPYVNDALTTIGLGLGVFIGSIRAWKTWRFRNHKD